MKKMLVAAGISAMLIASSAAAFANGAATDDAPRVVDRLSVDVGSSDEVVVPVKPGTPAAPATAWAYNALLTQASAGTCTTNKLKNGQFKKVDGTVSARGQEDCNDDADLKTRNMLVAAGIGITFVAIYIAANDDSESD